MIGKQGILVLRCLGEALASKGLKGLCGMVPFGDVFYEVGLDTYSRIKNEWKVDAKVTEIMGQKTETVEQQFEILAQAQLGEIREQAQIIFAEIKAKSNKFFPGPLDNAETKDNAEKALAEQLANPDFEKKFIAYLEQVPSSIRSTFRRPADPTGKSVPRNFSIRKPEDIQRLLPARPPRFQAGDRVAGTYILSELLGVGGFGEVWKATHITLTSQPPVALKFCLDPEASRFLKHEAHLMDQVMNKAHGPGIVELKNAFLENDPPCLAFEFINGGDLCGLMNDWLRLPLEKRIPLASQLILKLARILAPLHRLNPSIVHRDLKPANILVLRKDSVRFDIKIADFGIGGLAAKKSLDEATRGVSRGDLLSQTLRGSHTPLYASPEQAKSEAPDPRDDIHALGVIWFQLLTCDLQRGVGADFDEDLRELKVPHATAATIKKCVSSKRERRFADGQELAEHIANLAQLSTEPQVEIDENLPVPPPVTQQPPGSRPQSTTKRPPTPPKTIQRPAARSIAYEEDTYSDGPEIEPERQRPRIFRESYQKREGSSFLTSIALATGKFIFKIVFGIFALGLLVIGVGLIGKHAGAEEGEVALEWRDPAVLVEAKIDGKTIDKGDLLKPLVLPPGEHLFVVSGPDIETETHRIQIQGGSTQTLKVALVPKIKPTNANIPIIPSEPSGVNTSRKSNDKKKKI